MSQLMVFKVGRKTYRIMRSLFCAIDHVELLVDAPGKVRSTRLAMVQFEEEMQVVTTAMVDAAVAFLKSLVGSK